MDVDASTIFSDFILLNSNSRRIFTESTTKEGSFRQLAGALVGDWLEVVSMSLDLFRRSSVALLQGGAISFWPRRNRRSSPATSDQHKCRIDRRVADLANIGASSDKHLLKFGSHVEL
jgi:hypothetical protein